jgi:DNA-binding NtrC family response regulator
LLVSTRQGVSVVELEDGRSYYLGRSPEADIQVVDDSVSRKHALLVVAPDRVTLTDLGSSNGTRVDERPIEPREEVVLRIGSAFELGATTTVLQRSYASLAKPSRPPPARTEVPDGVVVRDPSMLRLYGLLDVIAPSPLAVLILGETGVGKEVFAEAIHKKSRRANKPFLQLNCAALPDTLLEGELFGHEKGAFTGATQDKAGLFESAHGGTIFLDEIGEVPMSTQTKLLRVLENGEVLRLGSRKPTRVDVRVLSATNRDLRTLIMDERFRSDLFYRLNGTSLTLPPLRKRIQDIVPLAEFFVDRVSARAERRPPTISAPAARQLERHAWPGNVRELRNVIERAVIMCAGSVIEPEHLFPFEEELVPNVPSRQSLRPSLPEIPAAAPESGRFVAQAGEAATGRLSPLDPDSTLKTRMLAMERESILAALEKTAGNQSAAAKMLGMTRRLLITRIEQYGIQRPRKGRE